jgi:hypothetical protein
MKPAVRIGVAIVAVVVVGAVAWRAFGPAAHPPHRLSGYVEGETLYVAASGAGLVSTVAVRAATGSARASRCSRWTPASWPPPATRPPPRWRSRTPS